MNEPTGISKRTKRGVLLLFVLCCGIIYTPRFLSWATPSEKLKLTFLEKQKLTQFEINEFGNQSKQGQKSYRKKKKFNKPRSKFDPNQYTKEDWMSLGLTEKQSDAVLRFSYRGFYSNEDLKKVYVINDELFNLIKDSTFYSLKPKKFFQEKENTPKRTSEQQVKSVKLIEINTATQEEIETLPGIGPYIAKKIIEKRSKLGGFIKKEQLLEVYRIDQERWNGFEKFIRVNPEVVYRLNINELNIDQLMQHPYIDYKIANSIVKMRQQKGRYEKLEELKESALINEELFQKLKPYVYL